MKNSMLQMARKAKGFTQGELAEQIGVDLKTVSRWEAGESSPQPMSMKAVCALLEKSPEELGFADPSMPPRSEKSLLDVSGTGIPLAEEKNAPISLKESSSTRGDDAVFSSRQDLSSALAGQKIYPSHSESPFRPRVMIHHLKIPTPFWFLFLAIFLIGGVIFLMAFHSGSITIPGFSPFHLVTPPAAPSSNLHQVFQNCLLDSNPAGYLKIITKQNGKEGVVCFSGTGSIGLSLDFVREVEVGNFPAQWSYLDLGGVQHLTPKSNAPNLYWCPKSPPRKYDSSIHIRQITVTQPSSEMACTPHL